MTRQELKELAADMAVLAVVCIGLMATMVVIAQVVVWIARLFGKA